MAAPVRVSKIIEVKYRLSTEIGRREYFVAICSWRAIGDCGHRHKTEKVAEQCVKPLNEKYLTYRRLKLALNRSRKLNELLGVTQ